MSEHERWDVLLEAQSGSAAAAGRQLLRGPVVALGAMPGSGGFALPGCRGLADRHCLITAYVGGAVSVVPVGPHQVRVAPHAGVCWSALDPIPGSVRLTEGCVLHLGPVTRGATVTFGGLRRLDGRAQSEVGPGGGSPFLRAREVGALWASWTALWFVGCLSMVMGVTAVALAELVSPHAAQRWVAGLGPDHQDDALNESVDLTPAGLGLRESHPEAPAVESWRHHVADTWACCQSLDVPSAQQARGRRAWAD